MTQDFSTTTPLTAPIGRAALIPSELKGPIESIEQYGTHPLHSTFIELYDAGIELTQMKPNHWRRPRFFHLTQILSLIHI